MKKASNMSSGLYDIYVKAENTEVEKLYNEKKSWHPGDAGYDLYFPEDVTIEPGETKLVNLGVAIEMKYRAEGSHYAASSYYLEARSSIYKTSVRVANSHGIIDRGYRGNLMVALDNIKTKPYTIKKGDRLVQITGPMLNSTVNRVTFVKELSPSSRGTGGHGSTGKN